MEDLLTKTEVQLITKEIESRPELRIPNIVTLFKLDRECTLVCWVTSSNGIIWIAGNSDTGIQHISERHYFSSNKRYWLQDKPDKLDKPSMFIKGIMPKKHFDHIVTDIYQPQYLNTTKNKRPELFDVYEGKSSYDINENKVVDFRLVLYKNSKIVHSLFPTKGKKNVFVDLKRGNCKGDIISFEGEKIMRLGVPYRDNKGVAIYSLQINYYLESKIEIGLMINHQKNTVGEIYKRKFNKEIESLEKEKMNVQYADLSSFEKLIKKEIKKSE